MKISHVIFCALLLALALVPAAPTQAKKCAGGQALDKAREAKAELEAMIAHINKLMDKYSEAKTVVLDKKNTSVTFKAGAAPEKPRPLTKEETLALDKYVIK